VTGAEGDIYDGSGRSRQAETTRNVKQTAFDRVYTSVCISVVFLPVAEREAFAVRWRVINQVQL